MDGTVRVFGLGAFGPPDLPPVRAATRDRDLAFSAKCFQKQRISTYCRPNDQGEVQCAAGPSDRCGAWRPNEYVPATGEAGRQGSTARPDYLKRNERAPRFGSTAGPGMQQGTHIGSEVRA